jgi:hypothetical protein
MMVATYEVMRLVRLPLPSPHSPLAVAVLWKPRDRRIAMQRSSVQTF